MSEPKKKEIVFINISGMPRDLLERIDKAAEEVHRSRSSFIVHKMWELFERSSKGPLKGGGGNRTREFELTQAAA
jgi:hypothetical protein